MQPQEIALIKQSFEKVLPISDTAARLFYNRLFELDPALAPLFKGDMQEQGRKLMSALKMVVSNLERMETIQAGVQQLARRHVDYGVREKDYATVGEALLWTLGQGLGNDFTPETKTAWTSAYIALAGIMQDAAYTQAEPLAAAR